MSTSPSAPSSTKATRVLACVLCQHRKIKCDRNTPCSNCIKANVTCTPSTPAPARKRRRPNQDLQERLARCEELLKTYASGSADTPPSATPSSKDAVTPHDPLPAWLSPGKVVVENGSTRFMGSVLWTSVYDELSAMRKIIDSDDGGGGGGDDASCLTSEPTSPDDTSELLMGELPSLSLEDVQPEPVQIFRMWQIFLDRVNPLSKVIHVPSLQPYIVEAATGNQSIPTNYQALIFAIYNNAVMAMDQTECRKILGSSKEAAHKKFAAGIRNCLVQVQFMKQHDLVILQTLTLYLLSLQGRYNRHALWIFSGVCVRVAQKMGLHRDGDLLKLTPFETEMRRRVWWHVIQQDAKCAMMSGVGYSLMPSSWDTKTPSNLNDADLFQGSTEPIPEREGPTEMGFCMLYYAINRFIIKCHNYPGFEAAIIGETMEEGHATNPEAVEGLNIGSSQYRDLLDSFAAEVREVQEKYLDPGAGPSQYVASHLPRLVLSRMQDFMVPMRDLPEYGTEIFGRKDNLFRIGLANIENALELNKLFSSRGFMWFCKYHFSVDVFAVMVGALVSRPKGSLADRAWASIDGVYRWHEELYDLSQKVNMQLAMFILKAWKNRVQALTEMGKDVVETPATVQELVRRGVPAAMNDTSSKSGESSATPASSTGSTSGGKPRDSAKSTQDQTDPVLEQFLGGGYMDMSMDWDMWENIEASGAQGQAPGGTFGAMGGFGPSRAWQV